MRFIAFILGITNVLAFADPSALMPYPTVKQAADFNLQDMQGTTHKLADYRGKVLVVNFWASWCSPCVKEMPSLQRAWEQLKLDAIQVLAVNAGENRKEIDGFTKSYPVSFPLLLDPDMALTTAWSVKGLPTTYIIDPGGQIIFQKLGDLEWDNPVVLQQLRALQNDQKQQ